jgi:hypothetical protein
MFRNRIVLAALLALAILPLVGCANRRCCDRPVAYAPPVVAAPTMAPTAAAIATEAASMA